MDVEPIDTTPLASPVTPTYLVGVFRRQRPYAPNSAPAYDVWGWRIEHVLDVEEVIRWAGEQCEALAGDEFNVLLAPSWHSQLPTLLRGRDPLDPSTDLPPQKHRSRSLARARSLSNENHVTRRACP